MQIELKCPESVSNHPCCDYESYVYLLLFESPNTRQLEKTQVNKAEMNCSPAGWQGTDSPTKSRWSHSPKTLQVRSPPEGLSCLSCPGPRDGQLFKDKPKRGWDVKGMDELCKQGLDWPFLKYQATDLFQGPQGKELPKAERQSDESPQ